MKPIAIIAAVDEEVAAVAEIMCGKTEISGIGKKFISGSINGRDCILAQSGVGKVNAAATAQFIIDRFSPAAVINTGSAGSVSESLDYGDIVLFATAFTGAVTVGRAVSAVSSISSISAVSAVSAVLTISAVSAVSAVLTISVITSV